MAGGAAFIAVARRRIYAVPAQAVAVPQQSPRSRSSEPVPAPVGDRSSRTAAARQRRHLGPAPADPALLQHTVDTRPDEALAVIVRLDRRRRDGMSRRFVPPAVAAFGDGPDADLARTVAQARDEGFAEGRDSLASRARATPPVCRRRSRGRGGLSGRIGGPEEKFAKQQATLARVTAIDRLLAARAEDLADTRGRHTHRHPGRAAGAVPDPARAGGRRRDCRPDGRGAHQRAPEALTLRANPATLRSVATHDLPGDHANRLTDAGRARDGFGAAEIAWCGGGLTFDPAALHERVFGILAPD